MHFGDESVAFQFTLSWTFFVSAEGRGSPLNAPLASSNKLQSHLSQARSVQLAMRQKDNMNTSSTVPGIIVISVFTTNLVSRQVRALPWRRTWCQSWCDWERRCCATPRPRRECCVVASCGRWGTDARTLAARKWGRQVCAPTLGDHQTLPAQVTTN